MKWEYYVLIIHFSNVIDSKNELDHHGAAGWELVSLLPDPSASQGTRYTAIFKRPRTN